MSIKNLKKNQVVLSMVLGIAIFALAGLSGAYAIPDQMQGHDFQDGQKRHFGNHNFTHKGYYHKGFLTNTTGINMTAFAHGIHNKAFMYNGTSFNMTAFKVSHPRPVLQNTTGYATNPTNHQIPAWIKNTAKYWSQGQVNDTDFVGGLQYMIKTGVIHVPTTKVILGNSYQIPKWVKSNANLWATGQMSEVEFIQSVQYLISSGIIKP